MNAEVNLEVNGTMNQTLIAEFDLLSGFINIYCSFQLQTNPISIDQVIF